MNLPIGEVISQRIDFRELDAKKLVESFYDKKFSGYIVATIEGFDGVEEGAILFKEGNLVASVYEYDNYGISVFGDSAFPQVFNSFGADFVVADIISLTNQQVDLVTAFNDRWKITKPVDKNSVGKLIPKQFSADYAKQTLSEVLTKSESKKDLFKKFGLSGLG